MCGDQFLLLQPEEEEYHAMVEWFERAFPIASWGRVAWEQVPGSRCLSWSDITELVSKLQALAEKNGLLQESVTIMWSETDKPLLKISAGALHRHATRIVEVDWDAWILSREPGWCIEVYHEGELCFGYAPSRNFHLLK